MGISMAVGTNGFVLTKSKLEEVLPHLTYIRINISAGEKKRYAEIMGVKESYFDRVIQNIKDMVEKWNDISFCLNYKDELMQVWVNGNKKHEIANSPINFIPDSTYFKYGIYRSFVSRYKNWKESVGQEAKLPTQIVYYDEIRAGKKKVDVVGNLK